MPKKRTAAVSAPRLPSAYTFNGVAKQIGEWVKKQPVAALFVAAAAGFLFGRSWTNRP
jgi:hypothetical protein